MGRISIEEDKSDDLMDRLKDLDKTTEDGRIELNTKVFESGLDLEEHFQEIKEHLCKISRELSEDMKTYRKEIKKQYDCKIEHPQRGHIAIEKHGNSYDYRLGEKAVRLVNGENLQSRHCPECDSQDYYVVNFEDEDENINNFEKTEAVKKQLQEREEKQEKEDHDGFMPSMIFNVCKDCGTVFKKPDSKDRFDPEKIQEAEKIGKIYRRAFVEAHSSIIEHLENYIGEGRGEWVTYYGYQYTAGAIRVDMPSMPKKPKDIDIYLTADHIQEPQRPFHPDVRMWKGLNGDQKRFPLRYRKLLDELATLNGCKVKVFGYKLRFENPQVIALLPKEPSREGEESEPISDPITPVYGHGYTVKPIEKQAVREYLETEMEKEEQIESEMQKYEKAAFLEIDENVEVEEK